MLFEDADRDVPALAAHLAREHRQIAVKVIDDRGNELLVVQRIGGSR